MTKQAFGPVMIDIDGLTLTELERANINHPNTGAIILFARNYSSIEQVKTLIEAIRSARQGDILIAVDQEGGRVQRFQSEFTRLPPAAVFEHHPELAEPTGWLMAAELLAVGVDFSFAPVLDVDRGVSTIIANRSFSQDYKVAAQLASGFTKGMQSAGMAATGKHFPGHGAVALDSHLALPVDERDLETILREDIYPFKQLIAQGLEAIMPAHVVYSNVDSLPAGFSQRWVSDILRGELGFDGVVFTDDLSMEGASVIGGFKQRATVALEAGCDMVLVCNHPEAAKEVLDHLPIIENPTRERRLRAMVGKGQYSQEQLVALAKYQQIAKQLSTLSYA